MIAWRSLSSIGIALAYLCVFLLSHGNFPLWTTCGVTSKLSTERVGSPGTIFELASLYGKMPLICRRGQVPKHSFSTQGSWLSGTSWPLRKKLQRYGPHSKTEGESANAWWGRRVYSPSKISQWTDQTELLDNNFRNMMKRDAALYGEEYMWTECIHVHRSAFLCWSTRRMPRTLQPTPAIESAGKPPARALCGSPSTRSVCSESWPPDCCESTFGSCSAEARLPGEQDLAMFWMPVSAPSVPSILTHRPQSTIWQVASNSWLRSTCQDVQHRGYAQKPPKLSCRAVLHL